jgi:hypothetical protein
MSTCRTATRGQLLCFEPAQRGQPRELLDRASNISDAVVDAGSATREQPVPG